MTDISPLDIKVSEKDITDLKIRLKRARWPEPEPLEDWGQGVPLEYAKDLVGYWATNYDWRECENYLNSLPQFTTNIRDLDIHFTHVRSEHDNALPLLITHGWPDSTVNFEKIIGPLVEPENFGGSADDAFHLVIPSLPGFAFSGKPNKTGWHVGVIAEAWTELMSRLGYSRYVAQGGDWGAIITTEIGYSQAEHCAGIHITMPITLNPSQHLMENLTEYEKEAIAGWKFYDEKDSGYNKIQRTRPQTMGYGLVDSPVAQATWIIDKFWQWTDCHGHLENVISRKQLFDNISIYWFTKSGASSARMYWESVSRGLAGDTVIQIPTGISIFPKEIFRSSRRWCEERFTDLIHYNTFDSGGHFAAVEKPVELVDEIRKTFRELR